MKRLLVFLAGSTLFGIAALGLAYAMGGTEHLIQAATALGLTFVPAAVTLGWVLWSYQSDPGMMLLASLGASGIRMAVALGGGYFLAQVYPNDFDTPFWLWLALLYPVFLAFEIALLVRQDPKLNGAPKA
jgi:hypothetical protein